MTATTATPLETLAQKSARQQAELEALRRVYESRETSLTDLNRQKEAQHRECGWQGVRLEEIERPIGLRSLDRGSHAKP